MSTSWSVVELKSILAEDNARTAKSQAIPRGLTGVKLEELRKEAQKVGLEIGAKDTKGSLMRRIRDFHATPDETLMTVGRFKGVPFSDIPETYGKWASEEEKANHDNMHPDLMRFVQWRRTTKARRLEAARTRREDPEVNARVPPPPLSETGYSAAYASRAQWDLVQETGTLPIAPKSRARAKDKRAGSSSDEPERMDQEVGRSVTEEIQALETRLAVLRDQNNLYRQN